MAAPDQQSHWLRNSAVLVAAIAALGTVAAAVVPGMLAFKDSRCRLSAADVVELNEAIYNYMGEIKDQMTKTWLAQEQLNQSLVQLSDENGQLRSALQAIRTGQSPPSDAEIDARVADRPYPGALKIEPPPGTLGAKLWQQMAKLIAACP